MKGIVRGGLAALAGLIAWAGVGAQAPATSSASGLDATVRAEIVDALAKRLASSYAVADAGEKMAEAVRSKLAAGAYDRLLSPEEFARALHADVRAVVDDRHLRVTFDGARPGARPDGPASVRPDARNGAIGRLEILAGNISYLSEGAPYTVLRVHGRQQGVIETKTTELGERSYGKKKPVYVLTSVLTFSGGEEFAYDVQAFKRGAIVGQTTGGGANPGGPRSLGHGFTVFVPVIEKEGHLVLQPSGQRPPSRLEQVSTGAFHLVGLPDDFTATFTSSPAGKRRLLLQQSNAWPPLLLEQQ
jgi:hypothetical protein